MPVYEYECRRCKSSSSELRSIADRLVAPNCPKCGKAMRFTLSPTRGVVRNPAVPRSKA
jgi:putative FmdB family regulatory protein